MQKDAITLLRSCGLPAKISSQRVVHVVYSYVSCFETRSAVEKKWALNSQGSANTVSPKLNIDAGRLLLVAVFLP